MKIWTWKILCLAVLPLVVAAALLLHICPLGMPGSEAIFYRKTGIELHLLLLLFGLGFMALFIGASKRFAKWPLPSILVISVLAILMQAIAPRPAYFGWSLRVLSMKYSAVNPFFPRASSIKKISSYPEEHLSFARNGYWKIVPIERRLTTYPPGLPIVYRASFWLTDSFPQWQSSIARWVLREKVLEEAAIASAEERIYAACFWGIMLNFLAVGLCPLLAGLLAKELAGQSAALPAAAMTALLPSLQIFGSMPDVLIAATALFGLWVSIRGVKRKSLLFSCAGAFVLGGSSFLSFSVLPILALCGLFLIIGGIREHLCGAEWKSAASSAFAWAMGGLAAYIAGLLLGYNAIEMFFVAIKNNHDFYLGVQRNYLASIPFNLIEVALFGGTIQLAWLGLAGWRLLSPFFKQQRLSLKTWNSSKLFTGALFVVIFLLLLSGAARGEVGRNWLCLFPCLSVLAASNGLFRRKRLFLFGASALILLLAVSASVEPSMGFWE